MRASSLLLAATATGTMVLAGCHLNTSPERATDDSASRQNLLSTTLIDIEGNQHSVSEADTKAALLLFVSHTCPVANAYVPRINRVYKQYSQRGVRIFVVQVDPGIAVEQLRIHAEEYELKPPVIHDADHTLVDRASATVTPQAVLFDPRGNIVYSGRIDDQYVDLGIKRREPSSHDLVNALEAFLAGDEVTPRTTRAVGCFIERARGTERRNPTRARYESALRASLTRRVTMMNPRFGL